MLDQWFPKVVPWRGARGGAIYWIWVKFWPIFYQGVPPHIKLIHYGFRETKKVEKHCARHTISVCRRTKSTKIRHVLKKIFQKRRTFEPKNTFEKANLIFRKISKIDFPSPALTKNVLQTMERDRLSVSQLVCRKCLPGVPPKRFFPLHWQILCKL